MMMTTTMKIDATTQAKHYLNNKVVWKKRNEWSGTYQCQKQIQDKIQIVTKTIDCDDKNLLISLRVLLFACIVCDAFHVFYMHNIYDKWSLFLDLIKCACAWLRSTHNIIKTNWNILLHDNSIYLSISFMNNTLKYVIFCWPVANYCHRYWSICWFFLNYAPERCQMSCKWIFSSQ